MKRLHGPALIAAAILGLLLGCDHGDDRPPCVDPPPPCIECPQAWSLFCGEPCVDEGAVCIGADMACQDGRWICWVPNPPPDPPDCEPVCQ